MSKVTYHNYQIIELYYQLIEDLNNGNSERALHIVLELVETKHAKYALKLLKRYAAREIGAAKPLVFITVKTLAEAWEKDKATKARGGEADRHYLALVVQYIADSNKSSDTKDLLRSVDKQRRQNQFFDIEETVKEKSEGVL